MLITTFPWYEPSMSFDVPFENNDRDRTGFRIVGVRGTPNVDNTTIVAITTTTIFLIAGMIIVGNIYYIIIF